MSNFDSLSKQPNQANRAPMYASFINRPLGEKVCFVIQIIRYVALMMLCVWCFTTFSSNLLHLTKLPLRKQYRQRNYIRENEYENQRRRNIGGKDYQDEEKDQRDVGQAMDNCKKKIETLNVKKYVISVNVEGLGFGKAVTFDTNNQTITIRWSGAHSIVSGVFSAITTGESYDILVESQPTDQTCTVTDGNGVLTAHISISVNCVVDYPDFKQPLITEYLKNERASLEEICEKKEGSYYYSWELPDSTKLEFENEENSAIWKLQKIDGVEVSSKTEIKFRVRDGTSIYLQKLIPFFPKVSGITVLQFLSALAYTCNGFIFLHDDADLTPLYKKLFLSNVL